MNKSTQRRLFLRELAGLATLLALPNTSGLLASANAPRLKAAGYRFPRVEALFDGSVSVEGFNTAFEKAGIGDANTQTFSGDQRWDFTEIGLHPFMLAYANDGFRDFTLLPIFPLRLFRHKSIFIRSDSGIAKPEDLRGRKVATPGYSSTSLTWIRGMLEDEYGVTPNDINWYVSRKDSSADVAGKASAQEQFVPEGIRMSQGPAGMDESEMLIQGEVDALFHAATPKAFLDGDPRIRRLFKDSRDVELAYYRKTGVFPIMHAVAVRKSLLEQNPGLAQKIFNAYSEAKQRSYRYMVSMGWAADMLPWYGQEMEHTTASMGWNFYSYGLKGNEKTLQTLFRYSHRQGLASRELTIEELFYTESLEFEE